jgi:hypothetical protein
VAVDLPYNQQLRHLRSCWRRNLDWQTSKWSKVGVAATCLPCQLILNMPPRHCPINYDVSYLILRQHTSSFHTRNLTFHFENMRHNTKKAQSQLKENLNLRTTGRKCFLPIPKNRYSAACSNAINLYEPNILLHLLNARLI